MREIKFRAWSKERMIMWHEIQKTTYFETFLTDESGVVMQYTGKKDKNGVEIYESDILSLIYGSINMIGYVKLEDSGEWIIYKDEGNYLGVHHNISRIKLIGNIHENPELLER